MKIVIGMLNGFMGALVIMAWILGNIFIVLIYAGSLPPYSIVIISMCLMLLEVIWGKYISEAK